MMRKYVVLILFVWMASALSADSVPAQSVIPECPKTSAPTIIEDADLDSASQTKNGMVYREDLGVGRLRLGNRGGAFEPDSPSRGTDLGTTDIFVSAAAADFNGDGWTDFVGGLTDGTTIVYRNHSANNLPANWSDPEYFLAPDFQPVTPNLGLDTSGNTRMKLAAGDFDGDGRQDIIRINIGSSTLAQSLDVFINAGNSMANDPLFDPPHSGLAPADLTELQSMSMPGHSVSVVAVDYSGDGKLDLLVGSTRNPAGSIHRFRNDCTSSTPPQCDTQVTFTYDGDLISDLQLDSGSRTPAFAYADFDADGALDLVAGGPGCCTSSARRLRLWKGLASPLGTIDTTNSPQELNFVGDAVFVLAGDFSLDGRPDLLVGTDGDVGSVAGGQTYYYENDGDGDPFLNLANPANFPTHQITFNGDPLSDFDLGLAFDYDNDPENSVDMLVATDSAATDYKLFSNRASALFVDSGLVVSKILDLGPLSGTEMVITSARIIPTVSLNGAPDIAWSMSNDSVTLPWTAAVPCADNPAHWCVSFTKPTGIELQWRAELQSDAATHTMSPEITRVEIRFNYTEALEHYRAGIVVHDGVAYVGAFRQPGNRGRFYAVNANLDQVYWEASAKLDEITNLYDPTRHIYTTTVDGRDRLDFEFDFSDFTQVTALAATMGGVTKDTVDWVRAKRFGVGNKGIDKSRLGAVETSTPAVVGKPGLPTWYVFVTGSERADLDGFVSANSQRVPLVLFGSRDGMLHAHYSDATNINDGLNGREAWAFIPGTVAGRMLQDFNDSASVSGKLVVTAYPDGSPTVADVRIGSDMRTVAVIGSGNGGKSVAAIDITQTVDPGDPGNVIGPDPLWQDTPGGGDAGQAHAKPAIIRVKIGVNERHLVVAGTGLDPTETLKPYSKGRIVVAYDVENGTPLWQAKTECPVTSNITAFETDDLGEDGNPTVDGFIDRVVFADKCGYVYKVDPAQDLGGAFMDNSALASTQVPPLAAPSDPDELHKLFSIVDTINALEIDPLDPTPTDPLAHVRERPIMGTIAARTDNTGDMVLFFGTGGLEGFNPQAHNEFFAVYAKSGEVRSKLIGACKTGPRTCEKFYGGVTATNEQVVFTKTIDPDVAAGTCDTGETVIQGVKVDRDPAAAPTAVENLVDAFAPQTLNTAAVSTSLFAKGGAVYLSLQSGEIVRVGKPRSPNAGDDTASGGGSSGGIGQGGSVGTDHALILMGWRQIF